MCSPSRAAAEAAGSLIADGLAGDTLMPSGRSREDDLRDANADGLPSLPDKLP